MVHGQCLTVGVGGYLLGGGFYVPGTTDRIGTASGHVLQYTMVDSDGFIVKVCAFFRKKNGYFENCRFQVNRHNSTILDPDTNQPLKVVPNNHKHQDLYSALQQAGSSYGITTEFLYRIFERSETSPAWVFVYVDTQQDLENLNRAAMDGRFHIFLNYFFNNFQKVSKLAKLQLLGLKILLSTISQAAGHAPLHVIVTDNHPKPDQTETDLSEVHAFLK